MSRSVAVTIAGQNYVLKSDADETHVRLVADLVDQRFRKVQRSTRQVATHAVAILTALQIADDLLREKRRAAELRKTVRERSRRILTRLDEMSQAVARSDAPLGESPPEG